MWSQLTSINGNCYGLQLSLNKISPPAHSCMETGSEIKAWRLPLHHEEVCQSVKDTIADDWCRAWKSDSGALWRHSTLSHYKQWLVTSSAPDFYRMSPCLLSNLFLFVCLFLLFGNFPCHFPASSYMRRLMTFICSYPLVLLLLSYLHIMSHLLNKDKNVIGKMSAFYRVDYIFVGTSCQANGGDSKRLNTELSEPRVCVLCETKKSTF